MKIKENIIFVFFVLVILAAIYFWYTQWRVAILPGDAYSQSEIFGVDFLSVASRMKRIQIQGDFLQSEAFLFLEDMTPVIQIPSTTGKRNPFLPLTSKLPVPGGTSVPLN